MKDKRALLPFIQTMSEHFGFAAIVPVSRGARARNSRRCSRRWCPCSRKAARMYEEDEVTTHSERFLAAELVREKLFRLLGDELPYATAVEIEQFETRASCAASTSRILVDRQNQKAIIIGKDGEKLKAIGTQARKDMEQLFGGKVFLELWVRVRSGWADDEAALTRDGIRVSAPMTSPRQELPPARVRPAQLSVQGDEPRRRALHARFRPRRGRRAGARRPKSALRGVLLAFQPLLVSWSGKGELHTLIRAEWQGGLPAVGGARSSAASI